MADRATPLQPSGALTEVDADAIVWSRRFPGDTTDRVQMRADGRRLGSNGSTAMLPHVGDYTYRPPTSGQFTAPAELAAANYTMTSQQMAVTLWRPEVTQLVSNIQVYVTSTAAGATPTVIRFGIYTISGTTATQYIATPNDTTLLAATFALSGRAVTTPAVVTRGTDYFLTALVVTGAAVPLLACRVNGAAATAAAQDSANGSGLRSGVITGQADLPASFTTTNITTGVASALWAWLT